MWMSSTMDGNKQERKWLVVERKALKWANANSPPPLKSPWWILMVNGLIVTSLSWLRWSKNEGKSNA